MPISRSSREVPNENQPGEAMTTKTEALTDMPPQMPDTSSLREYVRRVIEDGYLTPNDPKSNGAWETAPTPLLDIVGRLGDRTEWLLEFIDAIPSLDLTPPPVPAAPWPEISTDREKPTLAKVTYRDGREQTAKVYVEATSVRDEWHEAVAPVSYITNVTPLHTHDPETHVPVERALIEQAVRIADAFDVDPAWPFRYVEKIAALADGAQSKGDES